MLRSALALTILCLLPGIALATPLSQANQRPILFGLPAPGQQCRAAIAAAERGHGIPAQLLQAIGRVESGRRDPNTGEWGAWPWTINAEGQGSWFETKAEAIQAVSALQAHGVRSIDVGCMQVNLMHHPNAFASLDMAFEPAVNADYAARFLHELYDQTGDWTHATADYHSANPAEGGPYAAKVVSVWPEEQRKAGLVPTAFPAPGQREGALMPPAPMRPRGTMLPMVLPGAATPGAIPPLQLASVERGAEAPSSSSVLPLGMHQPGMALGASVMSAGHDLAFYRAVPVRPTMATHVAMRMFNRAMR